MIPDYGTLDSDLTSGTGIMSIDLICGKMDAIQYKTINKETGVDYA
jgi:hypothetical protein